MPVLIPILSMLPSLIHTAEGIFSSGSTAKAPDMPVNPNDGIASNLDPAPSMGSTKKDLVMTIMGDLYDFFQAKGEMPAFITRQFFLSIVSILIERLVPVLTKS